MSKILTNIRNTQSIQPRHVPDSNLILSFSQIRHPICLKDKLSLEIRIKNLGDVPVTSKSCIKLQPQGFYNEDKVTLHKEVQPEKEETFIVELTPKSDNISDLKEEVLVEVLNEKRSPYFSEDVGFLIKLESLMGDVSTWAPVNPDVRTHNILVAGPVGAGKSTLINFILSLWDSLYRQYSVSFASEKHVTDENQFYNAKNAPFRLLDTFGLDGENYKNNELSEVISGFFKKAYDLENNVIYDKKEIDEFERNDSKIHSAIFVVPQGFRVYSSQPQKLDTFKKLMEVAHRKNLKPILVVTRIDEIQPDDDIDTLLNSFKEMTGLSKSDIFLVQNSLNENTKNFENEKVLYHILSKAIQNSQIHLEKSMEKEKEEENKKLFFEKQKMREIERKEKERKEREEKERKEREEKERKEKEERERKEIEEKERKEREEREKVEERKRKKLNVVLKNPTSKRVIESIEVRNIDNEDTIELIRILFDLGIDSPSDLRKEIMNLSVLSLADETFSFLKVDRETCMSPEEEINENLSSITLFTTQGDPLVYVKIFPKVTLKFLNVSRNQIVHQMQVLLNELQFTTIQQIRDFLISNKYSGSDLIFVHGVTKRTVDPMKEHTIYVDQIMEKEGENSFVCIISSDYTPDQKLYILNHSNNDETLVECNLSDMDITLAEFREDLKNQYGFPDDFYFYNFITNRNITSREDKIKLSDTVTIENGFNLCYVNLQGSLSQRKTTSKGNKQPKKKSSSSASQTYSPHGNQVLNIVNYKNRQEKIEIQLNSDTNSFNLSELRNLLVTDFSFDFGFNFVHGETERPIQNNKEKNISVKSIEPKEETGSIWIQMN